MSMATPIEMKACGRLQRVTLNQLSNASISPVEHVEMAEAEMCLHPDDPDIEIVEADPGDLAAAFGPVYDEEECGCIQSMHKRYLEALGRGSWREGASCHPDHYPHEGYHAALVSIDHEAFLANSSLRRDVTDEEWQKVVVDAKVWPNLSNPVKTIEECKRTFIYGGERVASHDRPQWADRSGKRKDEPFNVFDMSTWMVFESIRRVGCLYIEVFEGVGNIHEKHIRMNGSLQGYAYFNDTSCGDRVTSNIRSNRNYGLGGICWLRGHEYGHTKNGQHQFRNPQSRHRSMMSYSPFSTPFQGYRLGVDPYWVNTPGNAVEDHSWPVWRRFFGDEAARPVVEPGQPEPPPDPGYNGIVVIDGRPRKIVVLPPGELDDIAGVFTYRGEMLGFKLLE